MRHWLSASKCLILFHLDVLFHLGRVTFKVFHVPVIIFTNLSFITNKCSKTVILFMNLSLWCSQTAKGNGNVHINPKLRCERVRLQWTARGGHCPPLAPLCLWPCSAALYKSDDEQINEAPSLSHKATNGISSLRSTEWIPSENKQKEKSLSAPLDGCRRGCPCRSSVIFHYVETLGSLSISPFAWARQSSRAHTHIGKPEQTVVWSVVRVQSGLL